MNKCALENVKTDLFVKKERLKNAELEAIKENRIPSQIEMYHDMSELYGKLLESLK